MSRVVAAIVWVACLVPCGAHAQTSVEELARAHFASGSAFYEEGRYEDAARAFMESYRLSPRAELLDNAARAYERALLFDESIATLRQIAERHPDYSGIATIDERIQSMERLRDRMRGGEAQPQPQPQPAATPPVAAPHEEPQSEGGGVSIPGIAVLAAGGAVGLVSIITGAVAHTIYEDLSASCMNNVCGPDRQGDIDTGSALAITSTVTFFTSIAAIGVGVVLLIVDSGGGSSDQAGLELAPGPGDVGLSVQGRF